MNRKLIEPIIMLATAAVALTIVGLWIKGWPIFRMIMTGLIGWFLVLSRVVPQIEWKLAGIATGVVCMGLTFVVLHVLARWMYGEIRLKKDRNDWPAAWRWKWTFCIIAGLMMMFIAGLVGVGLFNTTSWLVETPKMMQPKWTI